MPHVVDASTAVSWVLEEGGPANRFDLYERIAEAGVVVPEIWSLEVSNGLLHALMRHRLTEYQLARSMPILDKLPVELESSTFASVMSSMFRLALESGLTTYEATYVELAKRRNIPLVTNDNRVALAAASFGIEFFD